MFSEDLNWPVLLVMVLTVVGNTTAMLLVAVDRTPRIFRLASCVGDFILSLLFFMASLGTGRDLVWLGLMPLVSGALYFDWIGAGVIIVLNTILQGLMFYMGATISETLLFSGLMFVIYLVFGLGTAFAGTRWKKTYLEKNRTLILDRLAFDQREQSHRQTLYSLISELSATLNYGKVMETSLDLGNIALVELGTNIDRLVSALMVFAGENSTSQELSVASARRLLSSDKNVTLPGINGAIGQVIEDGTALVVREPKRDPELKALIALHECHSAYLMPLRMGLDSYGVLLFAHPDPDFFSSERREVLEIVRNQTTIAIQNAHLYQALEQEKNRMMEVQEESRKKLARDLHDGPTQSISAIAMRINFARRLLDRDPKSASEELYKIEDLARRTTKEIRHMLFTLRPLILESQGLIAALESMAEKMAETYDQKVLVQVDPRLEELLEIGKQTVVFYIVEEGVNNARKHAKAEHIWIRLKMIQEGISQLEIEDDGVGFDTSAVEMTYENRGSLGMINLKERTELISGALRIDSSIGRGTLIRVLIPLTEEAADRIRRGI
jgi:signal transduction histidine kinase